MHDLHLLCCHWWDPKPQQLQGQHHLRYPRQQQQCLLLRYWKRYETIWTIRTIWDENDKDDMNDLNDVRKDDKTGRKKIWGWDPENVVFWTKRYEVEILVDAGFARKRSQVETEKDLSKRYGLMWHSAIPEVTLWFPKSILAHRRPTSLSKCTDWFLRAPL